MKIKKIIATLLATITIAFPINYVNASAAIPSLYVEEVKGLDFYSPEHSFIFYATPSTPDVTNSFYLDGDTFYVSFNHTDYGTAHVTLYKVGNTTPGPNFTIDPNIGTTIYTPRTPHLGAGYYYFIITTSSTATSGAFSIGSHL